jgi:hypothetical protein
MQARRQGGRSRPERALTRPAAKALEPGGANAGGRGAAVLGQAHLDGAPVVRVPAQLDEPARLSAFTTRTPPE